MIHACMPCTCCSAERIHSILATVRSDAATSRKLCSHPAQPPSSSLPDGPVHMQAVQAWGMGMDVESSKRLAQSLDKADVPEDPYFNRIVRIMATRCMTQAKYFSSGTVAPSGFVHYGLAAPIYTHFTSPIRRRAPSSLALPMHATVCRTLLTLCRVASGRRAHQHSTAQLAQADRLAPAVLSAQEIAGA